MTEPLPAVDPLATAIVDAPPAPGTDTGVRVGTMQTASPLTVALQGGQVVSPGILTGVAPPAVGQAVALLRQDNSWLMLGPLRPGLGYTTFGVAVNTGVLGQTGAEAALNLASWSREPRCIAPPQTIMHARLLLPLFINNAINSVHTVRLRVGSVSAAGTQLLQFNVGFQTASVTLVTSYLFEGYFKNATNAVRDVQLSLTLATGTGSALVGAYSDNVLPLLIEIRPYMAVGVDPVLDGRLVQV